MTTAAPERSMESTDNGEIILVDKPLEWTSFDVVKKVRSLFHVRRVGHAGSLDPKATGLLIVCTGKQTRNIQELVGMDKEYVGMMELGVTTPSFDSETEADSRKGCSGITETIVLDAASKFVGRQLQTPPMYSAAKYGGKPLYHYARKGRTVPRASKEIDVSDFTILRLDLPMVEFRVTCSKGTYIRSLVHDLGQVIGCGATLRMLRRTRIGIHTVDRALTPDELASLRIQVKRTTEGGHADHS